MAAGISTPSVGIARRSEDPGNFVLLDSKGSQSEDPSEPKIEDTLDSTEVESFNVTAFGEQAEDTKEKISSLERAEAQSSSTADNLTYAKNLFNFMDTSAKTMNKYARSSTLGATELSRLIDAEVGIKALQNSQGNLDPSLSDPADYVWIVWRIFDSAEDEYQKLTDVPVQIRSVFKRYHAVVKKAVADLGQQLTVLRGL